MASVDLVEGDEQDGDDADRDRGDEQQIGIQCRSVKVATPMPRTPHADEAQRRSGPVAPVPRRGSLRVHEQESEPVMAMPPIAAAA